MSSPEMSHSSKSSDIQTTPAVNVTGSWTGVFWGTHQGIVSARFAVADDKIGGHISFSEPIGQYQAELNGKITGNQIAAELTDFSSESVTGLPSSGTFSAIVTETAIEGEWETGVGVNGKVTLLRNPPAKQGDVSRPAPAFIEKKVDLGCYRLDQEELVTLVNAVWEKTNVPSPSVSVSWDGHTVSKGGVQAILNDPELPAVVRNLTVAVNEPYLGVGSNGVLLTLKDKEPSVLVVNGNEPFWVEGKVAQIKRVLSHAEVKGIKYVRRYGPELNGVIFLTLIAFLPSVHSLWHRFQIIGATFALLFSLLYAWRLPSNTKVFLHEQKPSWWQKNGSAFLLMVLNVVLGGLVTVLIHKYLE